MVLVSAPLISEVAEGSAAMRAGLLPGDELLAIGGEQPLDVIEYQQMVDGASVELLIRRPGELLQRRILVEKAAGEPLGARVDSAVFDRIRTCDNHCEFCFIYQLPKGLRKSLYLKDDDYRLSFLYGNFTTLTRFTELDAERVLSERLSPLYVSIHATDPEVRASMLRNDRGATSLRWLDVLLDGGIEVHGQVVVCPGVNDTNVLEATLLDCLDRFGDLASVAVVPLGLSKHSEETRMRPHSREEAIETLDLVEAISDAGVRLEGRRRIFASDEYYLMAERPIPDSAYYDDVDQLENGIGLAAEFLAEVAGAAQRRTRSGGFFQAVDGAPPWGYRAERSALSSPRRSETPVLLTGAFGAPVLSAALEILGRTDVDVVEVTNNYFGGTVAVSGLLTASDLNPILETRPAARWILPDICLNEGRFLDGATLNDLFCPVEVVATSGSALVELLTASTVQAGAS